MRTRVSISFGVLGVLALYGFSGDQRMLLFALAVLSAASLVAAHERADLARFFGGFVALPLVFDFPGTHLGLWAFSSHALFGIPYWLPFLYGLLLLASGRAIQLFRARS